MTHHASKLMSSLYVAMALLGLGTHALAQETEPVAEGASADARDSASSGAAPATTGAAEPSNEAANGEPPASGAETEVDLATLSPADNGVYPPCPGEPTDAQMAAAKGAFQAGNAAFNEADYERAIIYWEDAYRRDCTAHAMLKNLARAYELNGSYTQAILALRTYSERNPNSGEEAALERRIANLQRKMEKERAEKQISQREVTAQQDHRGGLGDQSVALGGSDAAEDASSGSRSLWPLVLVGVGAGVAVVGAIQWKAAADDEQHAAELCPSRADCPPEVTKDGNDARGRMALYGYGFGGGGAALMVGGLIWYFVQDPQPGNGLTAVVSPRLTGLGFRGQF